MRRALAFFAFASLSGCLRPRPGTYALATGLEDGHREALELHRAGEPALDELEASKVYRALVSAEDDFLIRIERDGDVAWTHSKAKRTKHVGARTTVPLWDRGERKRATEVAELERLDRALSAANFWELESETPELPIGHNDWVCTVEVRDGERYRVVQRWQSQANAEFQTLCATFVHLADRNDGWWDDKLDPRP